MIVEFLQAVAVYDWLGYLGAAIVAVAFILRSCARNWRRRSDFSYRFFFQFEAQSKDDSGRNWKPQVPMEREGSKTPPF